MHTQFKKADGSVVDRNHWHWEFAALYEDGSELPQFDDDTGVAVGFFDIDQTKLKTFAMRNGQHEFLMDFPKGAKLIHKRITTKLKNEATTVISYMFGYELNGKAVVHQFFSYPDGNWLLVSADSKDSTKWIN